jgi:hypothetical protein
MTSISDLYAGILKPTGGLVGGINLGGSTVNAVSPLDASHLGLGAGNGERASAVNKITVPYSSDNFGGSGKSFSELSAGTGWGGILGLLGISVADAAGDTGTADAIIQAGPAGVEQATGGVFEAFAGAVPRFAIIILGFIFVAVGLAMFKNPVQMAVAAVVPP